MIIRKLIEQSDKLDRYEQRLLYLMAQKSDSLKLEIYVQEIRDLVNLNSRAAYRQFEGAIYDFQLEKNICLDVDGEIKKFPYITEGIYHDGKGYATITISPEIQSYLKQIRNFDFLDNEAAMRLYEMLKLHEHLGTFTMNYSDLKNHLHPPESYDMVSKIHANLIAMHLDKINDGTDIFVTTEPKTRHKAFHAIKFTVVSKGSPNPKEESPLHTLAVLSLTSINQGFFEQLREATGFNVDELVGEGDKSFETFLTLIFQKMGYEVQRNKIHRQHGVDLFIKDKNSKIAVQAKRYNNIIKKENWSFVILGAKKYQCDFALVVTTNQFDEYSFEIARDNGTLLIDRNKLADLIINLYFKHKIGKPLTHSDFALNTEFMDLITHFR